MIFDLHPALLAFAAISGGIGIYTAALALGVRHGIDWDHIAAITDITSATSSVSEADESWLIGEPGVMLTDESHHSHHGEHHEHGHAPELHRSAVATTVGAPTPATAHLRPATMIPEREAVHQSSGLIGRIREHRAALWLGTLYALGHGLVVSVLGVIAIIASEFLPDWIDRVMERVVGITLVFLAAYLFFSIYQYLRHGSEFRIRSRWMLVFAGVRNAMGWVRSRIGHHEHVHASPQQYGARTAFGIGLIHGVGAETGTQALVIASAVGATSQSVAVATLVCFVFGLLVSNSFVTLASTVGFVSARRRQLIYVIAGLFAAVFSLLLGLIFIGAWTGILPDLDRFVHWIGGPS